jgi:hypothetical protein
MKKQKKDIGGSSFFQRLLVFEGIILPVVIIIYGIYQASIGYEQIWFSKYALLIGIIFNLIVVIASFFSILLNRKFLNKFGSLELRLIEAVRCNDFRITGSIKYIISQIFACILSSFLGFFVYKLLLNILSGAYILNRFYDDKMAILEFFLYAIFILGFVLTDAISLAELRENGIIYGMHQVRWNQIYNYRWANDAGNLFAPRAPKGYVTLQTSYKGLLGPSILYIIVPKSLQSDINQVFASRLPPDASDMLIIPDSGWNLGFAYKINHLGIVNGVDLILWNKIVDCQWQELRDCHNLMSWYLSLRKQQKYHILQLKWGATLRPKHTAIAVPSNLFKKVNERLTKYLPIHIQIQKPTDC